MKPWLISWSGDVCSSVVFFVSCIGCSARRPDLLRRPVRAAGRQQRCEQVQREVEHRTQAGPLSDAVR